MKRASIFASGLAVLLATLACLYFVDRRHWELPYRPDFHQGLDKRWESYGGSWQLADDSLIDRSDERGAKIIAGSSHWQDYQFTVDTQLFGHAGDVGLILRVNDPEIGVDSYRGFYVGLRMTDNAVIAGSADYDWIESEPTPIPGGVHAGVWYRLHAVAVGCDLAVQATNLETGQSAYSGFHQSGCPLSGKIGLRSIDTGAAWRNLQVSAATRGDLAPIVAHLPPLAEPTYTTREDDYARVRRKLASAEPDDASASGLDLDDTDVGGPPLESIRSLGNTQAFAAPARIRGTVTLADPLYVQDSTGGVALHLLSHVRLNLGDEVELSGKPSSHDSKTVFDASSVRFLWDRSVIIPASITSSQAASGAFEGSLVELSGEIESIRSLNGGETQIELADIAQRFRVIVPRGIDAFPYGSWEIGGRLRVRGVCASAAGPDAAQIPFTLYTRNAADLQFIAYPPWTSGRRLLFLIAFGILVLLFIGWLYLKAERWRMGAILHERERLAIDMHDTLAQSFAGVGFHLQSMRKGLAQQADVPPHLMRKLDDACEMTAQTHREASARISALHPSAATDGDLLTLLQRSALAMLRGSDLPIKLERKHQPRYLSMAVTDGLLRIGQEAIANVLRHSKATSLRLELEYAPHEAILTIADNGVGIDAAIHEAGFGMESMRRSAAEIAARVSVETTPGEGTTVIVTAPYGKRFSLLDWFRFQYERHVLRK